MSIAYAFKTKLCDQDIRNLVFLQNIIKVMETWRMMWARHAERMTGIEMRVEF